MSDPVKQSEDNNKYGNMQFQMNRYSNAIHAYTAAISLCPQIAKYYCNRSACYLMLNEYVKALTDARKAIELDKGYKRAYIRIGKCCLAIGDMKYAENTLLKAKGIFPNDSEITVMYKSVKLIQESLEQYDNYMENKQYNEALICMNNCIKEAPSCAKYMTNKGRCLIFLQRFEDAKGIAEAILERNRTDDDAIFIKHSVDIYQNDVKNASDIVKELKKKLPDHPETVKLYRSTTKIYKNDQEIKKALEKHDYCLAHELLRKTLKIDEHRKQYNTRIHKQMIAIAGKDKRLFWNGIEDCTSFMQIYGKDKNMLRIRAEYYFDLQEYEDAIQDYTEILKFENYPDIKQKIEDAQKLFEDQLKSDYKILKISDNPSETEIRKAFNELSKRYHVDKNPNATPEKKKLLEQKLIRVRNAYKNLLLKHKKH